MSAASPISDLVLFPRLKQHSSLGYAIFMAEEKNQKNWQNLAMPINLQLRCDINYIHSHSIGQNGLQSLSQSHVAMKEDLERSYMKERGLLETIKQPIAEEFCVFPLR